MQAGFIEAHIARGNRNLLVVGLVLIVIGVVAALLDIWVPALVAVPGVITVSVWLRRVLSPNAHPVYKRLARYGDARQLAQRVNQDFAGIKPGNTRYFGARWLAQGHAFGVFLVPWQDVAWLHVYVQKTRNAGSVRVSAYVRVFSRDGDRFGAETGSSPEQAQQLLRELQERAPWAEVGYSPELALKWQKQRAEFLERVDARKRQHAPVA